MFGSKKNTTPRPLNDSGRSQVSESFALEGTLRTSGAIDKSGLIKGPVYANDIIVKETGLFPLCCCKYGDGFRFNTHCGRTFTYTILRWIFNDGYDAGFRDSHEL